jgi:hypothetical protein
MPKDTYSPQRNKTIYNIAQLIENEKANVNKEESKKAGEGTANFHVKLSH